MLQDPTCEECPKAVTRCVYKCSIDPADCSDLNLTCTLPVLIEVQVCLLPAEWPPRTTSCQFKLAECK